MPRKFSQFTDDDPRVSGHYTRTKGIDSSETEPWPLFDPKGPRTKTSEDTGYTLNTSPGLTETEDDSDEPKKSIHLSDPANEPRSASLDEKNKIRSKDRKGAGRHRYQKVESPCSGGEVQNDVEI